MRVNLNPVLVVPLLVLTASSMTAADTVWISSLDLTPIIQGWGQPQADKAVTGKPLSIGGQKFERGIGTHADSLVRIDLKGAGENFSGAAGVDDGATKDSARILFKVIGDGKTLWKAGPMKLGEPAQPFDLDIRGIKTLLLIADSSGHGVSYAHADWADAKLLINGERPVVVGPPHESAEILTPKAPASPRINGARIFGVRPGHPFLFTIPATGDRPMKFSVANLPKGLSVDPETGQITGKLTKPGEYVVTFLASNHLGRAERTFKIVCGDALALTPHMGWNSWYVWESRVSDRAIRDAADAMVSSGLINHGYQYVNIDDCWSVKPGSPDPNLSGEARDREGKVNANKRFPDMKALTDYIHGKGLKAGIYTSPGPLTCGGYVAAWQHEQLDARRFAQWGFDFLKYDWCSYGKIAKDSSVAELQKPYRIMGEILRHLDRDMVFNLCQYGMGNVWEWAKKSAGRAGAQPAISAGRSRGSLWLCSETALMSMPGVISRNMQGRALGMIPITCCSGISATGKAAPPLLLSHRMNSTHMCHFGASWPLP